MSDLKHEQAFELLPWLVNETLSGGERESVETHVRDCVTCRIALREQQRLRAVIRDQATVPLSAAHGFEVLRRELDRRTQRRSRWFDTAAAPHAAYAAAALGAAAVVLLAWLAGTGALDRGRAEYATLAAATTGDAVHVDVVFASWVTESDMRALLNDVGGTIVGGPSDIGRYTIRLAEPNAADADVLELMERLNRDGRVQFAGRTRMEVAP